MAALEDQYVWRDARGFFHALTHKGQPRGGGPDGSTRRGESIIQVRPAFMGVRGQDDSSTSDSNSMDLYRNDGVAVRFAQSRSHMLLASC